MISTYIRGNVTLSVEHIAGDRTAFAIKRTAPLTDDDIRRLNAELADCSSAQLIRTRALGETVVRRADTVMARDNGAETADLCWEETP